MIQTETITVWMEPNNMTFKVRTHINSRGQKVYSDSYGYWHTLKEFCRRHRQEYSAY